MAGSSGVSSAFKSADVTCSISQVPTRSYLVHSTNCLSIWGAGFAAQMAYLFPGAYERYRAYCTQSRLDSSDRWPTPTLVGRCLIIPPQETDIAMGAPEVSVVCLFTSYGYGRPNKATGKPGLDRQGKILDQTVTALQDFRHQLEEKRAQGKAADVVIYSPRINSGAFRVPWDRTKEAIQDAFMDFEATWNFMIPPGNT